MPLTFFRQITQDPPGYEEEPKPSTSKDASGTIPHAPPRSQIRFEKEVVNFPKGRDSSRMSYETAAILNQNLAYIPHIIG